MTETNKAVEIDLLEKSIKHWEENLQAARERRFSDILIRCKDCPLCSKYYKGLFTSNKDQCVGCPVREESGFPLCVRTPWEDVYYELYERTDGGFEGLERAIQLEISYLEELLNRRT